MTDIVKARERLERSVLVEIDHWGHVHPLTPPPAIDKTLPDWARSLHDRACGRKA